MNTPISKQAAFSLLEGLTENESTCGIEYDDGILCGREIPCRRHGEASVIRGEATVTLLDVLERMEKKADEHGRLSMFTWNDINHLTQLWQHFSFKTPLRDILEGATWKFVQGCDEDGEPYHDDILKDEKVEALLDLLISLQLVK